MNFLTLNQSAIILVNHESNKLAMRWISVNERQRPIGVDGGNIALFAVPPQGRHLDLRRNDEKVLLEAISERKKNSNAAQGRPGRR